jgi:transposase
MPSSTYWWKAFAGGPCPVTSPPGKRLYTYSRNWRQDGTWTRLHDRLREWTRIEAERHLRPSEVVIDSQSVKSAAGVEFSVGNNAGKRIKGRKRFLAVDTLGLLIGVLVTAASTPEREGGRQLLRRVKALGQAMSRLLTIWADGGFDSLAFTEWVMDHCRWIVEVVLSPKQTKGFVVFKK